MLIIIVHSPYKRKVALHNDCVLCLAARVPDTGECPHGVLVRADIVARVTRRCVDTRTIAPETACLFTPGTRSERGFQMQLRKHLSKLLRQKIKITAFSVWCEN